MVLTTHTCSTRIFHMSMNRLSSTFPLLCQHLIIPSKIGLSIQVQQTLMTGKGDEKCWGVSVDFTLWWSKAFISTESLFFCTSPPPTYSSTLFLIGSFFLKVVCNISWRITVIDQEQDNHHFYFVSFRWKLIFQLFWTNPPHFLDYFNVTVLRFEISLRKKYKCSRFGFYFCALVATF